MNKLAGADYPACHHLENDESLYDSPPEPPATDTTPDQSRDFINSNSHITKYPTVMSSATGDSPVNEPIETGPVPNEPICINSGKADQFSSVTDVSSDQSKVATISNDITDQRRNSAFLNELREKVLNSSGERSASSLPDAGDVTGADVDILGNAAAASSSVGGDVLYDRVATDSDDDERDLAASMAGNNREH